MPKLEDFKGTPYPIQLTSKGYLYAQTGIPRVISDLIALLLTSPGERVMLPNYGVGLRDFMFEPADNNLFVEMSQRIQEAISTWEPRIIVLDVNIRHQTISTLSKTVFNENVVLVTITFSPRDQIEVQEVLVLPVPLLDSTDPLNPETELNDAA